MVHIYGQDRAQRIRKLSTRPDVTKVVRAQDSQRERPTIEEKAQTDALLTCSLSRKLAKTMYLSIQGVEIIGVGATSTGRVDSKQMRGRGQK